MYVSTMHKKVAILLMSVFLTVACSGGNSIEEIASRSVESEQSQWNEDDYKTIAAKSCVELRKVNDRSLDDLLYDWNALTLEFANVGKTAQPLENHPKWGPIYNLILELFANFLSKAAGGEGSDFSDDTASATLNLCEELGGQLYSSLE
jgi:hypothetical protein